MPIKLESFLALEKALSKRMQASLTSLTKETYSNVGEAIKQGQWDEATRLLQAMQLSKVFEDNKGYVTYLTNLAMLFGASRVTASPGTSVVGLGFEKNTAYQMVQTFQQSVTQKAEAYLKTMGLQLIAQYRGDFVVVAKANPYHDELGRFSTKDGSSFVNRELEVANEINRTKFYHGSGADFDEFDLKHLHTGADSGSRSWYGHGVYLSGEEWKGSAYAYGAGSSGKLYSVNVKVKKPLVVEDTGASDLGDALAAVGMDRSLSDDKLTAALKAKGYDSIAVMSKSKKTINELVVFDAKKVKITNKRGIYETTKAEAGNPQPETTTSPKRRVLRGFKSFMDASGEAYFDMVSSLHTSRVSAYGFTAEAAALGIKEYQINEQLDNRICPVCATMHGKKFKVRDARRLLEVVTRVTDPDDIKQLQPWPSQSKDEVEKLAEMSEEELIGKGWHIPPFHPKCRGLLVRVGKVPSLADIKSGKRTAAYQATEDDFAPFGIKPGETLLKEWNAKVRVPPAEVAAVMGQIGIDEVLADLLSKMIPYLTEAKVVKTYVQVKGAAKIAEEMRLKQTLRFYGTKVALQELKDIPSDFDLKLYLRQLYTLAQDTGATSLEIVPDVGDLTALGFVASEGVNVLDFTNADSMKKFLE